MIADVPRKVDSVRVLDVIFFLVVIVRNDHQFVTSWMFVCCLRHAPIFSNGVLVQISACFHCVCE